MQTCLSLLDGTEVCEQAVWSVFCTVSNSFPILANWPHKKYKTYLL